MKMQKPKNVRIMYALYRTPRSEHPFGLFQSRWMAKGSGYYRHGVSRIVRVEVAQLSETSFEERHHEYRRI